MGLLGHILRTKLRSAVATALDVRGAGAVRSIASLVVFGVFAFGAFSVSHSITEFVLERTRVGLFLYHQFISMMLFVFFMAVNMGNIIVSYATLYRSPEVGFLLARPVPFLTIFVLKFLDNFLYSSGTLFLMGFMVLLGYGTYFHYPWFFFIGAMVFVLVPFMFLSACVAVLVLMAIMRAAGRFGFRTVMTVLFFLYACIIGVFFQFSNPVGLVESMNRSVPIGEAAFAGIIPSFLQYLPNQWVADFLYHLAAGHHANAAASALILLGISASLSGIVLVVAHWFYYRSWLVSLQVQSLALAPYDPHRLHLIDFRRGHGRWPQMNVLVKKEFFGFIREPSQWIHFLVMIVLTALFGVSVGSLNLRLRVMDVQLMTYLVLFAFGGFMTGSVALRFVFPMVGQEGMSFWLLRSAPLDPRKIYAVKFVIGFVLVFALAVWIALAGNIPFVRWSARRPLLLWFGYYEAFWTSFAVVGLNLGFGSFFANFQEKNPIRAASSQGATLTFLLTLLFLAVQVAIIILPLVAYFESLFHFVRFDLSAIVVPGTLFAVVSMLTAVGATAVGLRALSRDF